MINITHFDPWHKGNLAVAPSAKGQMEAATGGNVSSRWKPTRFDKEDSQAWRQSLPDQAAQAFAILTAHTLNSGILHTGSRAALVSRFAAASA